MVPFRTKLLWLSHLRLVPASLAPAAVPANCSKALITKRSEKPAAKRATSRKIIRHEASRSDCVNHPCSATPMMIAEMAALDLDIYYLPMGHRLRPISGFSSG